jgi:hypothetical protein
MSLDIQTVLIAILFASQVFVLSFLTPRRSRQFNALMFRRYPPEQYPKLYPVPREKVQRRLDSMKPLYLAAGGVAAITLFVSLIHGADSVELARRMFCCLILQILPLYVSLIWTIRAARAFRAMPPPHVRSVELRPWRVVDFVSRLWIGLGLVGQVMALACSVVAYLHRREALLMVLFCSIISGALLIRMIYVLLGRAAIRRADPYMSAADIFRVRQRRFQGLFGGGAALGACFAFMLLNQAQLIRFEQVYGLIGASIVMQLVWLAVISAQSRQLDKRDFSVYRADGASQAPNIRDRGRPVRS